MAVAGIRQDKGISGQRGANKSLSGVGKAALHERMLEKRCSQRKRPYETGLETQYIAMQRHCFA